MLSIEHMVAQTVLAQWPTLNLIKKLCKHSWRPSFHCRTFEAYLSKDSCLRTDRTFLLTCTCQSENLVTVMFVYVCMYVYICIFTLTSPPTNQLPVQPALRTHGVLWFWRCITCTLYVIREFRLLNISFLFSYVMLLIIKQPIYFHCDSRCLVRGSGRSE